MSDKIFAPVTAKERAGRFGQEFKISFNADKMIAFITAHKNAKGYVNLEMRKRREVGKFGDTHSVTLDTWEPRMSQSRQPVDADDIGF